MPPSQPATVPPGLRAGCREPKVGRRGLRQPACSPPTCARDPFQFRSRPPAPATARGPWRRDTRPPSPFDGNAVSRRRSRFLRRCGPLLSLPGGPSRMRSLSVPDMSPTLVSCESVDGGGGCECLPRREHARVGALFRPVRYGRDTPTPSRRTYISKRERTRTSPGPSSTWQNRPVSFMPSAGLNVNPNSSWRAPLGPEDEPVFSRSRR